MGTGLGVQGFCRASVSPSLLPVPHEITFVLEELQSSKRLSALKSNQADIVQIVSTSL